MWKQYKAQKEFEKKLEAMRLETVISNELKKTLERQNQSEYEAIMREMAKFGGEPEGDWIVYCDATGIYWR
jgi:hypothetical protein